MLSLFVKLFALILANNEAFIGQTFKLPILFQEMICRLKEEKFWLWNCPSSMHFCVESKDSWLFMQIQTEKFRKSALLSHSKWNRHKNPSKSDAFQQSRKLLKGHKQNRRKIKPNRCRFYDVFNVNFLFQKFPLGSVIHH